MNSVKYFVRICTVSVKDPEVPASNLTWTLQGQLTDVRHAACSAKMWQEVALYTDRLPLNQVTYTAAIF
jgi:hypothetical protein